MRLKLWSALLFLALPIGSGCGRLPAKPDPVEKPPPCDQHFDPDDPIFHGEFDPRSTVSDFLSIHGSVEALEWRLALADSARQTLDLQTFMWRGDATGALLLDRLFQAADRGVRVRILLDDIVLPGPDSQAAAINAHPNVEIRVFNPFAVRSPRMALRGAELLTRLSRLNHRMHNKLLLADNTIGIIGGRNIGNEYFGLGASRDFRDFDLLAQGPVVAQLDESFELFWNSAWTYPITLLYRKQVDEADLIAFRAELNELIADSPRLAKTFPLAVKDWSSRIHKARAQLIRGHARVVYDCPPGTESRRPVQVAETLQAMAQSADEELFLISPYLIPQTEFRADIEALIDRGVHVRTFTNSLEAADHTIAATGYIRHRPELLRMGAELYELKAHGENWPVYRTPESTGKYLSLHAKLVVFDRRRVYVGSLNLDPRSIQINTEIGLLIDSAPLAQGILEAFEQDMSPENSYVVRLDKDGDPYWSSSEGTRSSQPARSLSQRFAAFFYSLLPIEGQL